VVGKLVVAAALVLVACARPEGFAGGTGGGGSADLGDTPDQMPAVCGDHVCDRDHGESCSSCAADCGACMCPPGSGDCDGNPSNGCEANLNTNAHCGDCNTTCAQTGGTNKCVLVGASYVCQPTCDATHADCDQLGANGCETDITTVDDCGACGAKCANPHGTTTCNNFVTGAYGCHPTCDPGWARCGAAAADGCTTSVSNDPNNCGACNRACSTTNTASLGCTNGVCTPTCNAPWSSCSSPAAPGADDGCETNGTLDPGEPDNTCNGQASTTGEGSSTNLTGNRILPAGDADTFTVNLTEGSHTCIPLTGQNFWATITLTAPEGNLALQYNTDACNNTWTSIGNSLCVHWTGTCGTSDDRTFYYQVVGVAGASSCSPYTLNVTFCSEGDHCGCP
jgi:hypothetical protein